MHKTIAITGANGFIGTALVQALVQKGFRVKALIHHEPAHKIATVEYVHYSLAKSLHEKDFLEVDVLIHLAYSFKKVMINGVDINYAAIQALKELNLPAYIFMSSFAAVNPVTPSYYGLSKQQSEKYFENDLIIRPGLVLGNGGLFLRIQQQLQKTKWLPLLNYGEQIIQTIYIDDLVNSTIQLMEQNEKGIYEIAHPKAIAYKELMQLIALYSNTQIAFLPVPVPLMKMLIALMQILPKPPFSKDNLQGLLASKYVNTVHILQQLQQKWLTPVQAIEACCKLP